MAAEVDALAERLTEAKDRAQVGDPKVTELLDVVRQFVQDHCLVLYGGTALNETLCNELQFYDASKDFADYDFFSNRAAEHAQELAMLFYEQCGFREVNARPGMHAGTYKVFVDQLPIADITQMDARLFERLKRNAQPVRIGIFQLLLPSTEWLRVDLYLEFMKSKDTPDRWKKVFSRLQLINAYEDALRKERGLPPACHDPDYVRMTTTDAPRRSPVVEQLLRSVDAFAKERRQPILGGTASNVWLQKANGLVDEKRVPMLVLKTDKHRREEPVWEFLSEEPLKDAEALAAQLRRAMPNAKLKVEEMKSYGWELVPDMTTVELVAPERQMLALFHSTNDKCQAVVDIGAYTVGSLSTLLHTYHLRLFDPTWSNLNRERVRCVIDTLVRLQTALAMQQGGAPNTGMNAFFTDRCYGDQHTLEDVVREKYYGNLENVVEKVYALDVDEEKAKMRQQVSPYTDDVLEAIATLIDGESIPEKRKALKAKLAPLDGPQYDAAVQKIVQEARDRVDRKLAGRRTAWLRSYRAILGRGLQDEPACLRSFCQQPQHRDAPVCTTNRRALHENRPCPPALVTSELEQVMMELLGESADTNVVV
jgi:hypothetical protein